jgi:3-deoxy-manno-octulosonate cytidylyltransferase (CMP-KDO synthetase)
VVVATDDLRIKHAVESFGGRVEMTPEDLASGTDRVAHLAVNMDGDIFVNLQGDEPLVDPGVLQALIKPFTDPEVQMTTPVSAIEHAADLTDPNKVRVVRDQNGDALYFSRSVIPFIRDVKNVTDWPQRNIFYKHIGIYAYRKAFLALLTRLPVSELESAEKLEQLRVLENGYRIRTVLTRYRARSVDTPEDLDRLNKEVEKKNITMDSIYEN